MTLSGQLVSDTLFSHINWLKDNMIQWHSLEKGGGGVAENYPSIAIDLLVPFSRSKEFIKVKHE